jgi:hypothetical protein
MYKIIIKHDSVEHTFETINETEFTTEGFDQYYDACDRMARYVRAVSTFNVIVKVQLVSPTGETLLKLTLTNL